MDKSQRTDRGEVKRWAVRVLVHSAQWFGALAMYYVAFLWRVWEHGGGVLATTPSAEQPFPTELVASSLVALGLTTAGVWKRTARTEVALLLLPHLALLSIAAAGIVDPPVGGMSVRIAMNAYLAAPFFLMVLSCSTRWVPLTPSRKRAFVIGLAVAWVALALAAQFGPPAPRTLSGERDYAVPIRVPW